MTKRLHPIRAFTLLELLVSLALMAALFVALNQFVFSMGELWGQGAQRRLFERHATAVAYHLQSMLQSAAGRTIDTESISISDTGWDLGGGALLTMDLPDGDRVFPWPGRALPDVICSIQVQSGRGLVLHWLSRLEPDYKNRVARSVVLTPLGQQMEYEYYDRQTGNWASYEAPQKNQQGHSVVPSRLRIHFGRENLKTVRTIQVPARINALPTF